MTFEPVRAMQLKTSSTAHVLIRNGDGQKLFEMDIHGVCIAVTTPLAAEIIVDPDPGASSGTAGPRALPECES